MRPSPPPSVKCLEGPPGVAAPPRGPPGVKSWCPCGPGSRPVRFFRVRGVMGTHFIRNRGERSLNIASNGQRNPT